MEINALVNESLPKNSFLFSKANLTNTNTIEYCLIPPKNLIAESELTSKTGCQKVFKNNFQDYL